MSIKKSFMMILVLVCFSFSPLYAEETIRIATFNCEFLIKKKVHEKFDFKHLSTAEKDLWKQPGYRGQKFNEAIQAVAGFIKTINADILVLTEIGPTEDYRALIDSLSSQGSQFSHKPAALQHGDNSAKHNDSFFRLLSALPR